MKRKIFKVFLIFIFCFVSFYSSAFAVPISGKVIESVSSAKKSYNASSNAVGGAIVTIEGTNYSTRTDKNGVFVIDQNIPSGVYNVGAYKDGYYLETKRITITENATVNLIFILTKKRNAQITEADPTLQQSGSDYIPDALYVAFSAITAPGSPASSGNSKFPSVGSNMTSMQFKAAIAAGADINSLPGMPTPTKHNDVMNPQSRGDYYTPISEKPNTVAVMDPYAPKNTKFVEMNTKPYWVCFDNTGSKVFISTDTQYIHVLDANSNRMVGTIPSGGIVTDITRAPDGNVYASVSGSRPGFLAINPRTNSAIGFYPITDAGRIGSGAQPRAIAVGTDYIYLAMATNSAGEVIAVSKTGTVLGACPVGAFPAGMCLSPNGKYLFVANRNSGTMSVLDAMRLALMGTVRVGTQPTKVATSPTGDRIYVTNFGSHYLSVLDGKTCSTIATVPTGKGPMGVGVSADGTRVFVSNNTENDISIINAESNSVIQTTTRSTTSKPFGLAVRPGGVR